MLRDKGLTTAVYCRRKRFVEHAEGCDTDIYKIWRHLGKPGLLRIKQCIPISAFSICSYSYIASKLCRMREMLICDEKPRLWSDAAQNARRLIRACSFCPLISRIILNDVTNLPKSQWHFRFILEHYLTSNVTAWFTHETCVAIPEWPHYDTY